MTNHADRIRAALREVADPQRAPAMQAYMKSTMPFLGIPRPVLVKTVQPFVTGGDLTTALDLWDHAEYREERYAALLILRAHPAADEGLLRHLVVTGTWWDLVDEIATKLLGPLCEQIDVRAWARDENLWVRRAAIICQVGRKESTDTDLLRALIAPNLGDRTFWIAKAIGWALRDCARSHPDWVRAYVAGTPGLVPLSVREATKHL